MPYFDFLMESDKWSIGQLHDYQFEKCKGLLEFAQKYSPFYREHFEKCGFEPSKMESLDELKKIPPIDKHVLISRNKDIQSSFKFDKLFFSETSGTSGQVLKFYRNEDWDSCNRPENFSETPLYWSMPEYSEIEEEIEKLSGCDFRIAYVHWGNEFINYPYVDQKNLAHLMIDKGADIIIGMHPHVLQGFEVYKGKYIFYSLGNFVFNMPWTPTKYAELL